MAEENSAHEQSRQRALDSYRLLDTLPEASYDDIVRVASKLCNVPTALISLIDRDRQWFKAKVGIDVDETPRDIAFCDHAIRTPTQPMVIDDATGDARFSQNPLVTGEAGIRFYAGVPLQAASGEALGTVCVIDRVPRTLSADQLEGLQALARLAAALMEAQRERLQRSRQDSEYSFRSVSKPRPGTDGDAVRAVAIAQLADIGRLRATLGAEAVDTLLANLETDIRAGLAEGDIVGPHGEQELLLVMADEGDVRQRLAAIHENATRLAVEQGGSVVMGAAMASEATQPMESLFLRADDALSEARESGGERVVILDA